MMVSGLIRKEIPFSAGIFFSCELDCMTRLVIISFGICLKDMQLVVLLSNSFMVCIDLSTSGASACLATIFKLIDNGSL